MTFTAVAWYQKELSNLGTYIAQNNRQLYELRNIFKQIFSLLCKLFILIYFIFDYFNDQF